MMLATPQPQGTYAKAVHRQQCLDQAARCRRLAFSITDQQASAALLSMAEDYERSAWGQRSPG